MDVDRELIIRAQAGDAEAREALVAQFAPMVFRLISRFFRVREDVEDLAQEVFFRMFDRLDHIRPDLNFPGWLSRVTVNVCYDQLRKLRRRKTALENFGVLAPSPSSTESEPFGRAWRALDRLDPKLRIPLVLKEIEEMSIEEVARVMGLSQTNVKVRLFRARKKLTSLLKDSQ